MRPLHSPSWEHQRVMSPSEQLCRWPCAISDFSFFFLFGGAQIKSGESPWVGRWLVLPTTWSDSQACNLTGCWPPVRRVSDQDHQCPALCFITHYAYEERKCEGLWRKLQCDSQLRLLIILETIATRVEVILTTNISFPQYLTYPDTVFT